MCECVSDSSGRNAKNFPFPQGEGWAPLPSTESAQILKCCKGPLIPIVREKDLKEYFVNKDSRKELELVTAICFSHYLVLFSMFKIILLFLLCHYFQIFKNLEV